MSYFWSSDWGSCYPPANADDICAAANARIDAVAEKHGDDAAKRFSETLWEAWIVNDKLPRALRVYSVFTDDMEAVGTYTRKRAAIAAARKYAREHDERVYVLRPGGEAYLSEAWSTDSEEAAT